MTVCRHSLIFQTPPSFLLKSWMEHGDNEATWIQTNH